MGIRAASHLVGRYSMKPGFIVRFVPLVACALCLLVLLLLAVARWGNQRVSRSAVELVALTNVLVQPRSAVFGLTNLSHRTISFIAPEPQVLTRGVWSGVVVPGGVSSGFRLAGGQGANLTVAIPSHGEAWRMPIIWSYRPTRTELYVSRGRNLLYTLKKGMSLSGWNYGVVSRGGTNVSAVMPLIRAEPDGAANESQPIRSETNQTSSAAGSRR